MGPGRKKFQLPIRKLRSPFEFQKCTARTKGKCPGPFCAKNGIAEWPVLRARTDKNSVDNLDGFQDVNKRILARLPMPMSCHDQSSDTGMLYRLKKLNIFDLSLVFMELTHGPSANPSRFDTKMRVDNGIKLRGRGLVSMRKNQSAIAVGNSVDNHKWSVPPKRLKLMNGGFLETGESAQRVKQCELFLLPHIRKQQFSTIFLLPCNSVRLYSLTCPDDGCTWGGSWYDGRLKMMNSAKLTAQLCS